MTLRTLPAIKYEVTIYNAKSVDTQTMSQEEMAAINTDGFDHFLSVCQGRFEYQPVQGPRVRHQTEWPKLGPVSLSILQALQLNPGIFLTPTDLVELTGYKSLTRDGVLAARVHALRKAHGDLTGRFIQTRSSGGYGIRWSADRTWIWIERLPISASGQTV